MTQPDEDDELDALMRAAQAFAGVVASSFAQVDDQITWPQVRVLVLVATHDGVTAGSVAEALDISPSGGTRLCDRLVSAGLLDRRNPAVDRRRVTLHLTAAGQRLYADVMARRRAALAEVLGRLSPRDRAGLIRYLQRFSDAVGDPTHGAADRPVVVP